MRPAPVYRDSCQVFVRRALPVASVCMSVCPVCTRPGGELRHGEWKQPQEKLSGMMSHVPGAASRAPIASILLLVPVWMGGGCLGRDRDE